MDFIKNKILANLNTELLIVQFIIVKENNVHTLTSIIFSLRSRLKQRLVSS